MRLGLAREVQKAEKGMLVLAWISFVLAVAGGAAVATTFAGGFVSGIVGFFPGWAATLTFIAAFAIMARDLLIDGIPNRPAVTTGLLLPSLARAVPGGLGHKVTFYSGQVLGQVKAHLGSFLGTTSALGVAAVLVAVALILAQRSVPKGIGR